MSIQEILKHKSYGTEKNDAEPMTFLYRKFSDASNKRCTTDKFLAYGDHHNGCVVFTIALANRNQFLFETNLEFYMSHEIYKACIEACNACATACYHCAVSCLKEADVKKMARCIALDLDCAQACVMAAGAMARGSEHAKTICRLCAEICQSCGEECARHDMTHCQDCAKACFDCVTTLKNMAATA